MMDDLDRFIAERMKKSEFRESMENSELEYQIARAIMKARLSRNLTQKQVAELTGINQADLSRVENGNGNPKISTLYRIARGLRMKIKFDLIPEKYSVDVTGPLYVAEP